MKAAAVVLSALFLVGTASPAHAQLGALGKIKQAADKAADAKGKYDDLNVTDAEERSMGDKVSVKLREHFGVYQNEEVTKYVSLVGTVLAQSSTRASLDWKFIVLDTDGVNAYAAPGGFIHVTRGLLGLMKSESELAGVLGHEITHVTEKHTVHAIQKSKGVTMATSEAGPGGNLRQSFLAKFGEVVFTRVYEGEFGREDENQADQIGIRLANKLGYAPNGMVEVLKKIDARNGGREDRNGLFASHPATRDRIEKLEQQIKNEKLNGKATVVARYKQAITFDAKPVTEIATDVEGAAGLASGDKKKPDDKAADKDKDKDKKDDPKKNHFGLPGISSGKQAQAQQQTSSAGARGGLPDRDAKGGPNKNPLGVKVTAAECDAFKKGIVA
jgi:predicted Zn-dependent protease